jgi:hypothetical protein
MVNFSWFLLFFSVLAIAAVFLCLGYAAYTYEPIENALALSGFVLACINSACLFPVIGKLFFSTHTREFMPLEQYAEVKEGLKKKYAKNNKIVEPEITQAIIKTEEEGDESSSLFSSEEFSEIQNYIETLNKQNKIFREANKGKRP